MPDPTQEISLLEKMYCWCLSPDDQHLFYVRTHAVYRKLRPPRWMCGLFQRAIHASGVGRETLMENLDGFDTKESIKMAFHEDEASQKLVIISSVGRYLTMLATYVDDEQLSPPPTGRIH